MQQNGEVVDCRPTSSPSPFVQYKKASAMWISKWNFSRWLFIVSQAHRAPLMLINVNFSTNNLKTNRIWFSFLTTAAISLSFTSAILKLKAERAREKKERFEREFVWNSLFLSSRYNERTKVWESLVYIFETKQNECDAEKRFSHKFPWKENCKIKENLKLETSQHHLNNKYKCKQ